MIKNNVENFFEELAQYFKINIDHKWKSALIRKIGNELGIKNANRLSVWIKRGYVPKHAIAKIQTLDIPDNIKKLGKECKKSHIKIPFSLMQHDVLGEELQWMYNRLNDIYVRLSEHYSFKIADKTIRIINELNNLRSILDNQVFKENPNLPTKSKASIYYRTGRKTTRQFFKKNSNNQILYPLNSRKIDKELAEIKKEIKRLAENMESMKSLEVRQKKPNILNDKRMDKDSITSK